MAIKLRPFSLLAVALVTATLLLPAALLLPHNKYIQYQQLARDSIHYQRAKWIYERIHFDQTPIDIAFIGTSHTQSGVNSEVVELVLAEYSDPRHVVNFAIPHLGRDLQFIIAKELLDTRKVRTLVIEIQQEESRAPHPGFQRLADFDDIVSAPLFINTGVIVNFARLPMRQIELFAKSAMPAWFGLYDSFMLTHYEGPHFDDTYRLHGMNTPRTDVHPRSYFDKQLKDIQADIAKKRIQANRVAFNFLEDNPLYRYNNVYLRRMLELAEKRSVKVVFLYLPYLEADPFPENKNWFSSRGRLIVPSDILNDEKLWLNADHLNYNGANALSIWLADSLADGLEPLPVRSSLVIRNKYPHTSQQQPSVD